ncbi:hypothetical protein [Microbulbifer variabilis]|uniref:hypothetical protein n=1 Tax=Microbulbifer variabilis TaxID=266805 RepID=UPI001CFDADAF|nr:hypothetical protein [Microbulbifer variabilis]
MLTQAQLQLDYADVNKAVALLLLIETVYGKSLSTGLMLCKAWMSLNDLKNLESKSRELLKTYNLSREQSAAIYFCLSEVHWKLGNSDAAKLARRNYLNLINEGSSSK